MSAVLRPTGGAPIDLSLSGAQGSGEFISAVTFTYDGDRGSLVYDPSTFPIGTTIVAGTGTLTVTFPTGANITSLSNLVHFQPATTGPQSYNDDDVKLDYSVTVKNDAGASATFAGTSTVAIDAVADLSTDVQSQINGNGATSTITDLAGTVDASHEFKDGWDKDTFKTDYDTTKLNVTVSVSTTFPDTDGSESHYVLLEVPTTGGGAWTLDAASLAAAGLADAGTITEGGKTYYKLEVIDPTRGSVSADLVLHTPNVNGDFPKTDLQVGSLAVENVDPAHNAGREYDAGNNEAIRFDGTVSFSVDVINSTFDIKTGWASEGNNDAKHLSQPSSGYMYNGPEAGATSTLPDGTNNGAPINLNLSGAQGSAETFQSVTFTYDEARGSLYFNGSYIPSGTVIDMSGFNTTSMQALFVPATSGPQSFNQSDIHLDYSATVNNGAGASVTFTGGSTVAIDAVADRANVTAGTADYEGSQTAAKPHEEVVLTSKVAFPDTYGSENHYVLIETGSIDGFKCNSYSLDGGATYTTIDASTPSVVIGGVPYYQIPVDTTKPSFDVSVKVEADAGGTNKNVDKTYNVSIGGQSTVAGSDIEYDKGNNNAVNVKDVGFTVSPANSAAGVTVQNTYESTDGTFNGINPSKNMSGDPDTSHKTGADWTQYASNPAIYDGSAGSRTSTMGDIKFALTQGGGNTEAIQNLSFTIKGDLTQLGSLLYNGVAIQEGTPTATTPAYHFIKDVGGNIIATEIVFAPGQSATSPTSITVKFVPAAYSDVDLKITEYHLTEYNKNSLDTKTLDNINQNIVVKVDAVADRPTDLQLETDYADGQIYAQAGQKVDVDVKVKFADFADGSEKHYLLVQDFTANGTVYQTVTITLPGGGTQVVTIDTSSRIVVDGKMYFKVEINGSWLDAGGNLDASLQIKTPTDPATVDANGQAKYFQNYGAMSLETPTDGELTTKNNAAFNIKQGVIVVDVVASGSFTAKDAAAYENDMAHNNLPAAGANPVTGDNNEVLSGGTDVVISGKVATGEFVSKVEFTITEPDGAGGWRADGSRGFIEYNGTKYYADVNGKVTVTLAAGDPAFDGTKVKFVPTGHESGKVDLNISITVTDKGSLAEKTFDTSAEIRVDAVATRSGEVTVDPDYAKDAHGVEYTAALSGAEVVINVMTSFADNDGSEQHFVLVEAKLGWGNPQGYAQNWYDLDGDGVKELYWKVPVTSANSTIDANGNVKVDVILTTPSGIGKSAVTLKSGSLVEERNIDQDSEDRTLDNNVAMRPGPDATINIEMVQSSVNISKVIVYENDTPNANTGDTTEAGGAKMVISISAAGADKIVGDITLNCPQLAGGSPRGILYYDGQPVIFDASGKATITYDPAKQLVFVPARDWSDVDFSIKVSGDIQNEHSGHTVHFGQTGVIDVDAVATMPKIGDADTMDVDYAGGATGAQPGSTFTIQGMNARFEDFDGSEQHYLLVEAKAGWKVDGQTGWDIQYADGKMYYKIPLDGAGAISGVTWIDNGDGSKTASLDVDMTTPGRYYGGQDEGTLHYGAMAVDLTSGDFELTYHNNIAINDSGKLDINLEWGPGGIIWVAPAYENDTPNANVGDDTKAGGGKISLDPAATSFDLSIPAGTGSIVVNGHDYGCGPVTVQNADFGSVYFVPANNFSDTDVPLSYNAHYPNGSTTSGSFDVWVDAVAQQAHDVAGVVEYDNGHTAIQNGETFTISAQATFEDFSDGSESHYLLIEAKPGWECVTPGSEMISVDGKTYFRIPVDPSQIDANGLATVDVQMKSPTISLDEARATGGIITENFIVGAMSVEHPTDGEITSDNNVAVKFGEGANATVEVKMSVVDSLIQVSVGTGFEDDFKGYDANGNPIAGGGVPVTVSGLAASDKITEMDFSYKAGTGTLTYDGIALTDGYNANGITVVNNAGTLQITIANFDISKTITFTPADNHSSKDVNLSWNCQVEDTASGDARDFNGGKTIVLDAVAHQPTDVEAEIDYGAGHSSAAVGADVTVNVTASFMDIAGETPFILVQNLPGWSVGSVTIGGISVDISQVTLYYPTGNASGGTFFKIPVDPSLVPGHNDGSSFDLTAKVVLNTPTVAPVDEDRTLKVGGLTVDSFSDGETTLSNNWASKLEDLDLKIGVVETKNIRFQFSSLVEDDANGSHITLNPADVTALHTNNEIVTQATLFFQNNSSFLTAADVGKVIGTIIYDGKAYEVKCWVSTGTGQLEGRVDINFGPNGFDTSKDFRMVWGTVQTDGSGNVVWADHAGGTPVVTDFNHTGGNMGFNTQATIHDLGSGAEKTDFFNYGGGSGVPFTPTADAPTDIDVTDPTYAAGTTAVGAGANVTFSVSAKFVDIDGSEQHSILVEQKAGWTGSYPIVTIGGVNYFQISVSSTAANPSVNITLKTPANAVDGAVDLIVGGMAVDGSDTKTTFEPGDHATINIAVVDTTAVTAGNAAINEGDHATIALSIDGNNEHITKVVFNAPASGVIYYDGVAQAVAGGKVTINNFDSTKTLTYTAGDHVKGDFTLSYTATVVDDASGASKNFSGSTQVSVAPVTDTPIDPDSAVTAPVDQAGHTALTTITLQADFVDYSGTENHFFLVTLPAGVVAPSGWTAVADADLLSAAGLGGSVYMVAANAAGAGSFTLVVPENFSGGDIAFTAGSSEMGLVPPVYQFSTTETASIAPTGAINMAPTTDHATNSIDTHHVTEITGSVSMADVDGDTVKVNGLSHGATSATTGTDVNGDYHEVAGDHGTLRVYEDGNYHYTLHDQSVSGSENFSYTVSDGHGGTASATITVDLAPANMAPVAPVAEGTLGEHDTSLSGVLAVSDLEGDTWSVTKISFDGHDHAMPTGGSALQVHGEHGVLEIDANGSYSYTLNHGVVASSVNEVESFSYTVVDQFGGESASAIDVTLGTPPVTSHLFSAASINLDAVFDAVGAEAHHGTDVAAVDTHTSHVSTVIGADSSHVDLGALPDLPPIEEEHKVDTM